MVHYGRHIIVPGTDLCEICDRGILYERKRGRKIGKKFLYTNQDGRFTYRPNNVEKRPIQQTTPRQRRKSYHAETLTARSRPPAQDESPKRVVRRAYTPPHDIPLSSRAPPGATLYHVDDPVIQSRRPFDEVTPRQPQKTYTEPVTARSRPVVHEEPPKRIVQRPRTPVETIQLSSRAPPGPTLYYMDDPTIHNTRPYALTTPRERRNSFHTEPATARSRPVVQEEPPKRTARRAYTPPSDIPLSSRAPPAPTLYHMDEPRRRNNSQVLQTPPTKRQTKSDPDSFGRPYIIDSYDPLRKPNMYYLDQPQRASRYTPMPTTPSPPRVTYQAETPRKQRQLEPVPTRSHEEPDVTVVRRVYKKLPAGKQVPTEEEYIPNGNRPVRKVEAFYLTPGQSNSTLQSTYRPMNTPGPNRNPSIYYIQPTNAY
ncbi:unnamed protein product [Adineta ricciae]|uniref:Uncharacterized protein n=1 Tax=Adineta ricciae TaxID=249248 RepID=A0A815SJI0_ADIRI|nr:unnamed protein product [Adineta ricciae]